MKIQLIHPPADKDYEGSEAEWLKSAPIGLELIVSALDNDVRAEIIDGSNLSVNEIFNKINGDYVGVSDWYSKHKNALKILKHAKSIGAKTVIGGPNVDYLAERILENNSFVDYAIKGDGEDAFRKLIAKTPLEEIPNLVYRDEMKIKTTATATASLERIFNLSHLKKNYNIKNPFPLSSIRGCVKAETHNRCSFCSMKHQLKIMSPKNVWKQINLLYSQYGFNYFFETGDSFIVGNYPKRLLENRPPHLEKIKLRIYASPDQINEEIIGVLKKLNVKEIFLGVESVSESILKEVGKQYSKKSIDKAIELIGMQDIGLQVPFIFGLPKESKQTLEESYEYAQHLVHRYPSIKLLTSAPIPLAGSKLFESLRKDQRIKKEYEGNLCKEDSFDYQRLIELQTKHKTTITTKDISNYIAKTKMLVKKENIASFG